MIVDALDRHTLRALAKAGELTVEFQKETGRFGNQRRMVCTLAPFYLEKILGPSKASGFTVVNGDNYTPLRVFDLEAQDWRSFIPNNVTYAEWYAVDVPTLERKYNKKLNTFKYTLSFQLLEGQNPYSIENDIKNILGSSKATTTKFDRSFT